MVDVMGLELQYSDLPPGELEMRARAYWATSMAASWWLPFKDFVMVSERPTVLRKHDERTLDVVEWQWKDQLGNTQSWKVGGAR
jgi:competence CoiA-like predicted nuclease